MAFTSSLRLLVSSSLCLFIIGCHEPTAPPPAGYFGPTLPMEQVVTGVNANAEQIPTLRGAGGFEAWIKDNGKTHFINGEVTLLYAQPRSMRLIGKKDIAGQVFEIGSNADRYWVIIRGDTDTMWTGTYANIDHVDASAIPIQPDLLLEVLGVQPIPSDLLQQPTPVMRFNNDSDAYMLTWSVKLTDRWAAQKEIWYDRTTLLPKLVLLFDENGRVVLRAYLANHKPLEVANVPKEKWPKVATSYRLFFPDSGSKLNIDLDDVALKRNNAPNAHSFTYPGDNAGVSHVIQLDEKP
jgi:hypothetical protein